jgi:hypothetical protein
MTDHWGDFDFDDHHEVVHHDVPDDLHADLGHVDVGHVDLGHEVHDLPEIEDHHAAIEPAPADDLPEPPEAAGDLFPPALDVGDLPEPVDGFPWIDTATLGATPDPSGFTAPLEPVTPDELAAYAHTGQPADWATLSESDDPATAALAKWWAPEE